MHQINDTFLSNDYRSQRVFFFSDKISEVKIRQVGDDIDDNRYYAFSGTSVALSADA